MARQLVEVIDRKGHILDRFVVELDDADCHDHEYEEFALVLAETSGRVTAAEHVHLRARCVK